MKTGWIKLFRKFTEWEWYSDSNTSRLFIHLLLKANYENKKWQGNIIERGQRLTSLSSLASELNLSSQQVRTSLKKLESTDDISVESTNRFTLITISKYDIYQEENSNDNKQITNKEQTNNKQITTNKNYKKEKNYKNEKNEEKKIEGKQALRFPEKSEEFNNAFTEYLEMRRKIKKPATDRAIQMAYNKLEELSSDERIQTKILDQSTFGNWTGLYALKEDFNFSNTTPYNKKTKDIAEVNFTKDGEIIDE